MPVPITIPTTPVDTSKLLNGRKIILGVLPDGEATQINFRGKSGNYQQSTQRTKYFVPADTLTDGVVVGRVLKGATERSFDVVLDEITQEALDRFVESASLEGKARIWVLDEKDAANTAALLSNEFTATITLNGGMPIDPDNVTTFTITVDIIGTFTLSRNGATV